MNTFAIEIQSSIAGNERFSDVVSFSGRDSSGSFGILANAERRITVLTFGLASFRRQGGEQEYLALPGGLLYFRNNELLISTRNYVHNSDFNKITSALENEIRVSEEATQETRHSLRKLDEEILRRLSKLNWRPEL